MEYFRATMEKQGGVFEPAESKLLPYSRKFGNMDSGPMRPSTGSCSSSSNATAKYVPRFSNSSHVGILGTPQQVRASDAATKKLGYSGPFVQTDPSYRKPLVPLPHEHRPPSSVGSQHENIDLNKHDTWTHRSSLDPNFRATKYCDAIWRTLQTIKNAPISTVPKPIQNRPKSSYGAQGAGTASKVNFAPRADPASSRTVTTSTGRTVTTGSGAQ